MNTRFFSKILALLAIAVLTAAAELETALPKTVIAAQASASAAIQNAHAAYLKAVADENHKLAAVLESEKTMAMKNGDLDLAVAIRTVQRATNATAAIEAVKHVGKEVPPALIPITDKLPDDAFSALASWRDHPPHQGRFSSGACWASAASIQGDWWQVDLGAAKELGAIGMLGRAWGDDQRVTSYTVETSLNEKTWEGQLDGRGEPIVYPGAELDRDTEIRVTFAKPIHARYVRITPVTWNSFMSMRCELYVKP